MGLTRTDIVFPSSRRSVVREQEAVLRRDEALDARMRIRATGTPLEDFLRMIASEAKVGLDLKAGRGKDRVTLDLRDVSAREALQAVLEVKSLDITAGKNGYEVVRSTSPERP